MLLGTWFRIAREAALAGALAACACGGGAPAASEPDSVTKERASESRDSTTERPSAEREDESPVAETKPSCSDGTCIPCGDGECPTGFFCDEGARGGPACGWLPECARKPTCSCVKRALAAACEEKHGGLYVKGE